jgi:YqaJ-like viral recombinase domain
VTDDRTAWLKARESVLTASDVAAVMGLDPNKSRRKVLELKTGQRGPDGIDRIPAVAAGRHLESGILAWFAEDHPEYSAVGTPGNVAPDAGWVVLCERGDGQQLVRSPVLECLAATPDGVLRSAATARLDAVEVKCCEKSWAAGAWRPKSLATLNRGRNASGDCVPQAYWIQLQVQMHCLGLTHGWLTGLQGAHSRADRYFALDKEFEARMLTEVAKFWAEVEAFRSLDLEAV